MRRLYINGSSSLLFWAIVAISLWLARVNPILVWGGITLALIAIITLEISGDTGPGTTVFFQALFLGAGWLTFAFVHTHYAQALAVCALTLLLMAIEARKAADQERLESGVRLFRRRVFIVGALPLVGWIFALLCMKYEWFVRTREEITRDEN